MERCPKCNWFHTGDCMGIHPAKTPMEGGFSLEKFMPGLLPEDAEAFANALESADLSDPNPPKNAAYWKRRATKAEARVAELEAARDTDQERIDAIKEADRYREALEELRDSYGRMHDDKWIWEVASKALEPQN